MRFLPQRLMRAVKRRAIVWAIHDDDVLQADIREKFADAVLGQLFDVVVAGQPAKDDAFGPQLDRKVSDATARA